MRLEEKKDRELQKQFALAESGGGERELVYTFSELFSQCQ